MSPGGAWSLPWWKRYPGRLLLEIEALNKAGIRFAIDDVARREGRLSMSVTIPAQVTGSESVVADVHFPEFYPQFRPNIVAPSLSLPHHHDPFGGNLCLIGRDSRMWSEGDTLAWLLVEQLPVVLAEAGQPDPNQGEPASHYFRYASEHLFLIDSDNLPPATERSGTARTVMPSMQDVLDPNKKWVASVAEFEWSGGSALGSRTTTERAGDEVRVPWVRVDNPLIYETPDAMWNAAVAIVGVPRQGYPVGDGLIFEFIVVLFPEEHLPGELGTGALVVCRVADPRRRAERRRARTSGVKESKMWIRTMRAGRSDLTARAPDLKGLSERNVLIVGCGALGSTIADQLARAGVGRMTLVDGDRLEPGNLMRHTGFIEDVGLNKSMAVAVRVRGANPEIIVESVSERIGMAAPSRKSDGTVEGSAIPALVMNADLVIDASAEIAVHELLSDIARAHGTSYLYAEVTWGAGGGYVFSFSNASGACWNCSELHVQQGRLTLPANDPAASVQPVACAEPTFIGANVDVSEVALHAARVATVMLNAGGGPTQLDSVELRDASGQRGLPQWARQLVAQHNDCPWHE